jgi:hypothetical protein
MLLLVVGWSVCWMESLMSRNELVNLYQNDADMDRQGRGIRANETIRKLVLVYRLSNCHSDDLGWSMSACVRILQGLDM